MESAADATNNKTYFYEKLNEYSGLLPNTLDWKEAKCALKVVKEIAFVFNIFF